MEIKMNASLEFVDLDMANKVVFGKKVSKCLETESKTFTNLPYPTATLLATTNDLDEAEQEALSGDSVAIEKRNELNELWNTQFRRTAAYVSFVANGNATLIKSSGFTCTKGTRQRKGKIEMINNFIADVKTAKGTADVSCKSVESANGYLVLAATENTNVSMVGDDILVEMNGEQLLIKMTTQSKVTLTGLPSKTSVGITMCAFNTAGTSPLADVQTITPQ